MVDDRDVLTVINNSRRKGEKRGRDRMRFAGGKKKTETFMPKDRVSSLRTNDLSALPARTYYVCKNER